MKARGSRDSRSIRVLSPRIEPPDRAEDGSTASTATRSPCPVSIRPKLSMKVDLPTPGVPDSPIRSACRPRRRAAPPAAPAPRPVIGPRAFDQRDRARQRPAVAGDHAVGKIGNIHRAVSGGSFAHRHADARELSTPCHAAGVLLATRCAGATCSDKARRCGDGASGHDPSGWCWRWLPARGAADQAVFDLSIRGLRAGIAEL